MSVSPNRLKAATRNIQCIQMILPNTGSTKKEVLSRHALDKWIWNFLMLHKVTKVLEKEVRI